MWAELLKYQNEVPLRKGCLTWIWKGEEKEGHSPIEGASCGSRRGIKGHTVAGKLTSSWKWLPRRPQIRNDKKRSCRGRLSPGNEKPVYSTRNFKLDSQHFGKQVKDLKQGSDMISEPFSNNLPEKESARKHQRWCTDEICIQSTLSEWNSLFLRIDYFPPQIYW